MYLIFFRIPGLIAPGFLLGQIQVWAPVIWFNEQKKKEDIFEEQLVEKSQLQIIRGGAEISNFAFTEGLGYANSTGTLIIHNRTLCEELKRQCIVKPG